MNQAELIEKALAPDTFTLLRLFENYRGIDRPQTWLDLMAHYHSVYEAPDKRPKTAWRPERMRKALDAAWSQKLIDHETNGWMITAKGLEARKAETLRRMRG